MDENLKKLVEVFCSDIGMTMTTAFCILQKQQSENKKYRLKYQQIRSILQVIFVTLKRKCL
jgi:hypothetical protein